MLDRYHENILADSPPSPDQLKRLASIGTRSAAERNKLKQLKRTAQAHFFVDEMDLLNINTELDGPGQIRHRMAGRIGVTRGSEYGEKQWSLKYFDTYWVEQDQGVWRAERTLYSFRWNRVRATLAERSIRLIGYNNDNRELGDLGDAIDNFSMRGDEPDIWHAHTQLEMVNSDDCEELIGDAVKYFNIIDSLESQTT